MIGPATTTISFEQTDRWLSARIYSFYRLAIAILFSLLYWLKIGPSTLGQHDPALYQELCIIYVAHSCFSIHLSKKKKVPEQNRTSVIVIVDLLFLALLMHASGGLRSGIGILMAIPIAAGSLISNGRSSLMFAALASITLLAEQIYAHWAQSFETTTYSQAGMLGMALFTIAILAHEMAKKIDLSQKIIADREKKLRDLQRLNSYVVQHLQSGIIICAADLAIMNMNSAALAAFNITAPPSSISLLPPPLLNALHEWRNNPDKDSYTIFENSEAELQLRFTWINLSSRQSILIFLENSSITNQRIQQAKLASIGSLTASIAHEIRNPIGAISHAIQLLQESSGLDLADRTLTEIISRQSKRVNQVIENIMQLSKGTQTQRTEINLADWLTTFINEYELDCNSAIKKIHRSIPSGSHLTVRFDSNQLKHILTCLLDNAEKHAGPAAQTYLELSNENNQLAIKIRDDGPGISPSNILRIFEPFFSTDHQSTGLGLYIAKGLAELNGAQLDYVDPGHPGKRGFLVSLPSSANKQISL